MAGGGGGVERLRDRARRVSDRLGYWTIAFVVGAAFPRLAYWSRWPSRLGPRGLAAYIACNTTLVFAVRTWAVPYFRRMGAEQERSRAELAQALGREPTEDEVLKYVGLTCKRRRACRIHDAV